MTEKPAFGELESSANSLFSVRESILNNLLIAIAIVALPTLFTSLYRIMDIGWQNIMYFQIIAYLVVSTTAIFHRRLSALHKALTIVSLCFLVGCIAIFNMGLIGSGILFMFFSIIFTTMFYGVRYGGAMIIAAFAILVAFAVGFNKGLLVYSFNIETAVLTFSSWISKIFAFVFFSTMLIVSLGRLITHLVDSSRILEERTVELRRINKKLMKEISERKKTEKALQNSEKKYRLLAENATDRQDTGPVADDRDSVVRPGLCEKSPGAAPPGCGTL